MNTDSPVITDEECAEMLGCKVDHVQELAAAGELPGTKIGRAWRFVRADVLAALSERAKAEAEQRRSRRAKAEHLTEPVKSRRREPPSLAFVRQE